MKLIKCPKCGSTEEFYEKATVLQTKYFHQDAQGRIEKVSTEETNSPNHNSRLYCSICDKKIEEDYDLFLDRYSDSLFSKG